MVNTKGYEGQRFKVTAKDKADVTDDSASARLWVKIVVTKGYGFFNNMQYQPIRSSQWKTYTIEGKVNGYNLQLTIHNSQIKSSLYN